MEFVVEQERHSAAGGDGKSVVGIEGKREKSKRTMKKEEENKKKIVRTVSGNLEIGGVSKLEGKRCTGQAKYPNDGSPLRK